MTWIRRVLAGGSTGNEHLTAAVAAVLLLLLAVEGATLLRLQPLLTVHAFVGMLLIPVVALKFASTGWRMLRYYGGGDQYVGHGPPPLFLRALVAPVLIVSTIVLLATGSALLALDQTEGRLHFAGADVNLRWLSWMVGCVVSGKEAGREIVAEHTVSARLTV